MDSAYNVYEHGCPAREVFNRLADKWALLLLDRLKEEPVRFNQLKKEIKGISQKMLSQTLKKLERDGLLTRSVFPTVPVTVEYQLTPLGMTLTEAISALIHWSEQNMPSIESAQQRYDETNAG